MPIVDDRIPPGSIVSKLVLWLCCALAAINIVAAIFEWPQFQTFLMFLILWWLEFGLSCLALIIILFAQLPGWRTTVVCLIVAVLFIAANAAAVQVLIP